MNNHISSANTSFNYLSSSSDFLNMLVNNLSSCILLLNSEMELQAYNDAIKTIFSNKPDEDLLYQRCGDAIGCAHTVEETKNCGDTSKCKNCELRESALHSYLSKEAVFKERISREFFKSENKKVMKHLQFSTRPFYFENDYYILMIVDDISQLVEQENVIKEQKEKIESFSNTSDF